MECHVNPMGISNHQQKWGKPPVLMGLTRQTTPATLEMVDRSGAQQGGRLWRSTGKSCHENLDLKLRFVLLLMVQTSETTTWDVENS